MSWAGWWWDGAGWRERHARASCGRGRSGTAMARRGGGLRSCRRTFWSGSGRMGWRMDVGELHGADACGGGWRPGADVLQQEEWDGLVEEDPGSARQKATDPTPGGAPREIPKERRREPSPAQGWPCGFTSCSCCGKPA
ncbi:unnamed protein product [Prorocentrum cordatum]|uniref:Uncharacterized protein n=1 Tax=Prorocentrum cordatum TaxID=2364126 RepID=A0ABN9QID4_9DINO|nr:unnamed protein product [Polarella glacialis]